MKTASRPRRRRGGPMTMQELYAYYYARSELWKFFAMFGP
jgi:hypothetical protein